MANVGYVRVSSVDQNTARQLDSVTLDRVFEDKVSGATTDRPQLQEMLKFIREGDTVHIHSIDRLARSLEDLLKLVKDLNTRKISVHFHKEQLLFTGEANPMQELMLSLLGSVAQFERAMIKERQREGIAKAKEAGAYKGRVKSVDDAAIRVAMQAEGASFRKVAKALDVSLSSVQRAMKASLS
ncbi:MULTISPECIES: recombinase family protein [unclassified Pseudomonas]|uniref:recombinase family protein n=1 Tax=unclassified Pseudomonas TaxID=196821 RepID=UPI00128E4AE0|nr:MULTISPECIES: recombinase family protein [unclassified Pseudomonas]MPQ65361.1 resolvase [Pseudomonas sp. MWU12-2323]